MAYIINDVQMSFFFRMRAHNASPHCQLNWRLEHRFNRHYLFIIIISNYKIILRHFFAVYCLKY